MGNGDIQQLEHRRGSIAQEILAVQLPAYRVEAELIGTDSIPALRDTVESIGRSEECFVGYRDKETERLLGVISYDIEPESGSHPERVSINRLVVHPEHFRKGIGRDLLSYVMGREALNRCMEVHTGAKNAPAIQLYRQHGFVEAERLEVEPGLWLVRLERSIEDPANGTDT
ncbi:N-acetyltransferase [Paenibacillus sp. HB172176]|uniref:GNAT family N-acetyltransferase n=1 Tax=Paenibacillus sp. HB172176 TaxID=2493690 RepID=UPI00143B35FD|nr:N-acetyltransferase [Paenibacillus sp. HB172176]